MAHRAILTVADQEVKALEFMVAFKQARDEQGNPSSDVSLGDFYMILDGGTDYFFEWLVDKTRFENGTIKTYRENQDGVFLTYEFENAFVTDVSESFYLNVGTINTTYNRVSGAEDMSDDVLNYQYQQFRFGRQNNVALQNMWHRVRQFQERTGIPYCLFITMSCEKLKIQDRLHDNKWPEP